MALNETVVVAVIGGIAAVAAATIPVLISKRKNKSDVAPKPLPSDPLPATPISFSPYLNAPELPKTGREDMPISPFTIKEMEEHLKSVPLFHRTAAEQHYTGLRVRWRAKLDSIDPHSTRSSIYAHAEDGYTELSCSSTPVGIANLIHAQQNSLVLIDGIIKRASSSYCELIDCFIIPESPANSLRDLILKQTITAREDAPLMQLALSEEAADQDIAHQIRLLIESGLIKGEVLSANPLAFYITQITPAGQACIKNAFK